MDRLGALACGRRLNPDDVLILGWWLAFDAEYKLVLVVAAALIDGKGQVLLAQRPEGRSMAGLWEFPGGKVGAVPLSTPLRNLASAP